MGYVPVVAAMDPNCPAAASADPAALRSLARQQHADRGFLWEIRKGERRFHLYGTVHVARLEWDFPGPLTRQALEAAPALAVELDLTDPTLVRRLRDAAAAAPSPAPAPASAPTSAPQHDDIAPRVRAQFAQACLNEAAFAEASLSSRVTSLTLLSARGQGLFPDYAIDAALVGYARARGKAIVELEQVSQQAAALEGDPASVRRDLEKLESGEARLMLLRLTGAWARSDRAEIEGYFSWCNCNDSPQDRATTEHLVGERNATLAAQVVRFYEHSEGGFAAIGILHMVGPHSVLHALAAAGYQARAVVPGDR